MNFLENINNKTLIIANNNIKLNILNYLNSLNNFFNIKIMNIDEFLNHYFFSYDEKTIIYLTNKYKITIEIAKIYLYNLKYIINCDLNDPKIIYLKDIYKDLKENKYLKTDNLFTNYLDNLDIIVINKEEYDNWTINILNKYNVKYYSLINKKYYHDKIYHFNDIEDECFFVFNKISELLKSNINYSNIKIIPLGNEYLYYLKRFSYLYKIPLNNLEKESIYSIIETKKLLKYIKDNNTKDDILNYIKNNINLDEQELYLNVLNKYYFIDNLLEVIDYIEYDLKNTYLNEKIINNAVDIIDLDFNLINDNDYVFMLGFNQENIPKTYLDIDYLNDTLKSKIGIFTSIDKNKYEKDFILKNIFNIKNLTISYKDKDPYKNYAISNLNENLLLKIEDIETVNNTSNLYNKIKLTNEFDMMLKYDLKFNDTSILLNTYKDIPYLKYSNKWKGLTNFKLNNILLSYTSLNNYYHCSFKYYIDNILNLNIFSETFKIYIGNMFHYILSKIYNNDFEFELEWNNYIKDKKFSCKEIFYLNMLKDELIKIINVIKYQYKLTGLSNLMLEKEIVINYNDNNSFKGIIDKIMFKEKDNNTYISLIDYKTGIPKIDFSNIKYGIDMQLPIYLYLITKSNIFNNPKIIGFYLEQILHEKSSYDEKDIDERRKDNLKLIGYSIDDPYLVSMFDETYENSEMIKGMKITSKGFSHWSKVINESEINTLIGLVDQKIMEAFKNIELGKFDINPKIIKGENIGCSYCKYNDLCYKTGNDLIYLEKENCLDSVNN